jgi:hypothetical protein
MTVSRAGLPATHRLLGLACVALALAGRMSMRRVLVIALPALLALALAPAADAHGRRLSERHVCKIYRCTTIAASAKVRVFEIEERQPKPGYERNYRADFAVWLPTGKVTEIIGGTHGSFEPNQSVSEAKIAGPYVAYRLTGLVEDRYDYPEVPEKMGRLDVENGQRTSTPGVDVEIEGQYLYFAVSSRGTVAWAFENRNERTICLLPAGSATTTVLAHGRLVEPASLALVPGHLYWLEDGVPHTFAVP